MSPRVKKPAEIPTADAAERHRATSERPYARLNGRISAATRPATTLVYALHFRKPVIGNSGEANGPHRGPARAQTSDLGGDKEAAMKRAHAPP